jgi:hypothetical protein
MNYSTREALDAIPTWAVAEMLSHNGDLSTKQLTTAMETGMAYNVLGMAMSRGFQAVGKRAKFQDAMTYMFGTNNSEKVAKFAEFKNHPLLKQFGEQNELISYKSRILGDWFANPVQGLWSAAVMQDGNWVENADKYLKNEALGDLVTGALLSAHMTYGNRNKRNNYYKIYDNIVAQERQREMNANFEKQTKDFVEPTPPPVETVVDPVTPVADNGEIDLNAVMNGTGEFAGVDLAVADINAAGGVLGENVEHIRGDSGDTSTDIAQQTADSHISAGVSAIVGAASSGVSFTVIDKIAGAGIVHFSPANT